MRITWAIRVGSDAAAQDRGAVPWQATARAEGCAGAAGIAAESAAA